MHTRTVGILLGAILTTTDAAAAASAALPNVSIQVHLDGLPRPDLRTDLLHLEVEASQQTSRVSIRVLNYRLPPGGTTPVFYYSEGPTRVPLGALLRVTIDGEWHECPVTQLTADFPVSKPPDLTISCQADRPAPRRSAPEQQLPLAGFSANVTAEGTTSRVSGQGILGPGWGVLRVNDMAIIAGASSLSGTYRLDNVRHTFDLTTGPTTSYQATRVRP